MDFRDCGVGISLEKQYLGLEGDYHVVVMLRPSTSLAVKASDIRVSLTDYRPGKIRFWNVSASEPFVNGHPSRTPSIDPSHPETLIAGKVYAFVYTFNGRHRRKLKIEATVSIDGESIRCNADFTKHTQVSLFH